MTSNPQLSSVSPPTDDLDAIMDQILEEKRAA
jgi:hypothetical protein